ncbi:putative ISAzo13 family transposase ISAzo13 [Hollandina sp. SP2]
MPLRRTGRGCLAAAEKKVSEKYPRYERELENLLDSSVIGDPEKMLRHVSKSAAHLSDALKGKGIQASPETVRRMLKGLGYRMQGNRKVKSSGAGHPDRDAQFQHIKRLKDKAVKSKNPVISVDTKKKEVLGAYKNGGKEWHKKGESPIVADHDFIPPDTPRAYPYGIYDLKTNRGFVNGGTSHDTSCFAVASIRAWWKAEGAAAYPQAEYLLLLADGGGSNGSRRRQWKYELHGLSNEIGLPIRVCRYPPGISKWNKIEHGLFPFISMNWRGVPLTDYQTIVDLIRNTRTRTGLRVQCQLDTNKYDLGVRITDEQMSEIKLRGYKFHKEWNYTLRPSVPNM